MSHLHDQIDFTVEVFIVYQDKVLLRKHDKYKIWLSVGGHIEHDEDPNQAAIREVKEEVGLDIHLYDKHKPDIAASDGYQELVPPAFMNRHRINDTHEHVTVVYFAKADTNKINELVEREQSEECRWFTREEIETSDDMRDNVRHYALAALNAISN